MVPNFLNKEEDTIRKKVKIDPDREHSILAHSDQVTRNTEKSIS